MARLWILVYRVHVAYRSLRWPRLSYF
jgi:hypothetical protein